MVCLVEVVEPTVAADTASNGCVVGGAGDSTPIGKVEALAISSRATLPPAVSEATVADTGDDTAGPPMTTIS